MKKLLILSSILVAIAVGSYFIWRTFGATETVTAERETRSAMLSYLSNPRFTHPGFSEQLTGTKAKLEINQLDEHLLYFSINKEDYQDQKTLKLLCLAPNKVEFAKQKNGALVLGNYTFTGDSSMFFRFPDSLFRVQKNRNFQIDYAPNKYRVSTKELVDLINNRTIYGGDYYITRNGEELGLTYGMNHGAFVAKKGEPSIKRFVKQLTADCETKEEEVQTLLNFVTNRIKYSFTEAYSGSETLKRPSEVIMSGTSDCSGKAILFASFLEQIAVDYRLAYMKGHISVFVKGNFPQTNGYTLNVDGYKYVLAEVTCPDFRIGETILDEGTIFSFVQYTQKVGSPSIVINNTTGKKFEL
jgi:hypothetical protein